MVPLRLQSGVEAPCLPPRHEALPPLRRHGGSLMDLLPHPAKGGAGEDYAARHPIPGAGGVLWQHTGKGRK